jgi:hypothetical protein
MQPFAEKDGAFQTGKGMADAPEKRLAAGNVIDAESNGNTQAMCCADKGRDQTIASLGKR